MGGEEGEMFAVKEGSAGNEGRMFAQGKGFPGCGRSRRCLFS